MDCPEARISLGVYVLGAIDPAERALVDAHLATCRDCRDELAGLAGLPGPARPRLEGRSHRARRHQRRPLSRSRRGRAASRAARHGAGPGVGASAPPPLAGREPRRRGGARSSPPAYSAACGSGSRPAQPAATASGQVYLGPPSGPLANRVRELRGHDRHGRLQPRWAGAPCSTRRSPAFPEHGLPALGDRLQRKPLPRGHLGDRQRRGQGLVPGLGRAVEQGHRRPSRSPSARDRRSTSQPDPRDARATSGNTRPCYRCWSCRGWWPDSPRSCSCRGVSGWLCHAPPPGPLSACE